MVSRGALVEKHLNSAKLGVGNIQRSYFQTSNTKKPRSQPEVIIVKNVVVLTRKIHF